MVEEFELPQLTKLQTNVPKAEDIMWCGFLEQYDEQYDRISTRTEKKLVVSSSPLRHFAVDAKLIQDKCTTNAPSPTHAMDD